MNNISKQTIIPIASSSDKSIESICKYLVKYCKRRTNLCTESNYLYSRPTFISSIELTILSRIKNYINHLKLNIDKFAQFDQHGELAIMQISAYSDKLISFLMSQLSECYTINYYPRNNIHSYTKSPYPDDIDDTFTALFAIYKNSPKLITANHIATLLMGLEKIRSIEEPFTFNTWYINNINSSDHIGLHDQQVQENFKSDKSVKSAWIEVDPIVNSSIQAFFSELSYDQNTKLLDYILKSPSQDTNKFNSRYYHSSSFAHYLISRIKLNPNYHETYLLGLFQNLSDLSSSDAKYNTEMLLNKSKIIASISHIIHENPEYTSKYFRSLNQYFKPQELLNLIFEHDFDASELYIESDKDDNTLYAKSIDIDKLIIIECLFSMEILKLNFEISKLACERSFAESHLKTYNYKSELLQYLYSIDSEIRDISEIDHLIEQLLNSNDFLIIKDFLLHFDLNHIRVIDHDNTTSNQRLEELKIELLNIHLIGLVAYNLYDKICDSEFSVHKLPIFLKLKNRFIYKFEKLIIKYGFNTALNTDLEHELDNLESTYLNLNNCGYIDHVNKSLAQFIIPSCLAYKESVEIKSFYKHYLIARQILDDLKDFEHDRSISKITTMTYFQEISDQRSYTIINTKDVLDKIFWHIEQAELTLSKIKSISTDIFKKYLNSLNKKSIYFRFELAIFDELRKLKNKL